MMIACQLPNIKGLVPKKSKMYGGKPIKAIKFKIKYSMTKNF